MASGIDVNTLIVELREHLGVQATDPDWTDTSCLLILNRSFWELLNKFEFREKERKYELTFSQGEAEYTLPSNLNFESIQSIGCQDPYTSRYHKLRRVGINVYQNEFETNTIFQRQPEQYFRREPNDIIVYPTPDKTYNAIVYYLLNLENLETDEDVDIPREWHELILLGGIWRGYFKVGDMDRANLTKDIQTGLINSTVPVESKEETDSSEGPGLGLGVSYAGVRYPGRGTAINGGRFRLWK